MTTDQRRLWTIPARGPLFPPGHAGPNRIPLTDDWQLEIEIATKQIVEVGSSELVLRFDPDSLTVSADPAEVVDIGPSLDRYAEDVAGQLNAALFAVETLPKVSSAWSGFETLSLALRAPGFSLVHPTGVAAQEERRRDLVEVNRSLDAVAARGPDDDLDPQGSGMERLAGWLADVRWAGEQQLAMDLGSGGGRFQLALYQADFPQVLRQGLRFTPAAPSLLRKRSRKLSLEPQENHASVAALSALARQRLIACAMAFDRTWGRPRPEFSACVVLRTGRREDRFILGVRPEAWPISFPAWVEGRSFDECGITFSHEAKTLQD